MEELLERFKTYLLGKKKPYVETVMKDLGLEEHEVVGLVEMLKKKGYLFDIINDRVVIVNPVKENDVYKIPSNMEHLKLLLISDTHLASKYDRLDILRYLYDRANDDGVDYILHSGDLTEGFSGRPQQLYELKEASYTGQRDYVVDKYPKSNIPTYIIAGNHDYWWVRECGSDIVKDICNRRDDLHYLGSDCEDMMIGKLKIRLYHGCKGQSYAKSYKIQKYLDSIPSDELPHILETGHIHQAFYMKQGNTHCFQTSCLQDLTPYERSMGFGNDKSAWWVDIWMDDKGNPVRVSQELETFGNKVLRKKK